MARASFTAVGASAGSRVTRVAPQGVSLQGMSRHGVGTPDTFSTSTVQAVAASHAGLSAAAVPRQVELADPHLASTALKREQLTYLVRCALPEDIELYTPQGAERFTFPGRIGLAPRWLSEAMTPSEERWVSACVLAHVNYFGKPVMISLRAEQPPVPALQASDDEQQIFSIFEGGFFGNLFTPHPVAYTCQGARARTRAGSGAAGSNLYTGDRRHHR